MFPQMRRSACLIIIINVVNQSAVIGMRMSNAYVEDDDGARQHTVIVQKVTERGREREGERESKETHHLTELDGRLPYLIPNPNRDLKTGKRAPSITYPV